ALEARKSCRYYAWFAGGASKRTVFGRSCMRRTAIESARPRVHLGVMTRTVDPFAVELTPELIIRAYQAGIFPMAETADSDDLFWVSPQRRGVIPLDRFHMSRSLRKLMRNAPFEIR